MHSRPGVSRFANLGLKPSRPFRSKGKQKESVDQRVYVRALNALGIGYFYRVRNMGTFDPVKKVYRKHGTEVVAVPDICGYTKAGQAVYIEVKRIEQVEKKKKLVFSVKISNDQKRFLKDAHNNGCRSGVAFNISDCLAIATGDNERYPRHPRTYAFMEKDWLELYAEDYTKHKSLLAERNKDPVQAEVILANPDLNLDREDWEAIPD